MDKEFNQGVKILLARMDSNPEEFYSAEDNTLKNSTQRQPHKKWQQLIYMLCESMGVSNSNNPEGLIPVQKPKHLPQLTQEEKEVLYTKYLSIVRDNFTKDVMEVLLEEPRKEEPYTEGSSPQTLGSSMYESKSKIAGTVLDEQMQHEHEMRKREIEKRYGMKSRNRAMQVDPRGLKRIKPESLEDVIPEIHKYTR